jgi:predicted kinase
LASEQMFIQMSGAPGAGKTTIATAIAARIQAVILDHDVAKSALLNADVPVSLAGKGSYLVLGALAQHLLRQGHSVIFDSPCFYVDLLERGQRLAHEAHARYFYIECVVDDLRELDRRLRTRPRQASQVAGVQAQPTVGSGKTHIDEAVFRDWIANMKRPEGEYLVLDTTQPLEACIEEAMDYLNQGKTA